MIGWLKFYFLGFIFDEYGKEGSTRSGFNTLLSFLLAVILLSGGISAGYAASFGTNYSGAEEFRNFAYSAFASDDLNARVGLQFTDGKLSADRLINNFDKEDAYSLNGYSLIVDTRAADSTYDDFKIICKNADGVEINYEDYRKLSDDDKGNFSVKFEYTGVALDVTAKQAEYSAYLDKISTEGDEGYDATVAAAYNELKQKKEAGEITDEDFANEIYVTYAKSYYPAYSSFEVYGGAPTLRTYYMQSSITQGKDKYLILLDDLYICCFKSAKGITVDFGGYYNDIENGIISSPDMTVDEARLNVDGFIEACFMGSGGVNFVVHLMNVGRFMILLIIVILLLGLITSLLCRWLKLEFGTKFFGNFKIIGGYLFYAALVSFVLEIILSFFCPRSVVAFAAKIAVICIVVLRTVALFIAEYIRAKRKKPVEAAEGVSTEATAEVQTDSFDETPTKITAENDEN